MSRALSTEASFMSDATSQTVYFYNRHPDRWPIGIHRLDS